MRVNQTQDERRTNENWRNFQRVSFDPSNGSSSFEAGDFCASERVRSSLDDNNKSSSANQNNDSPQAESKASLAQGFSGGATLGGATMLAGPQMGKSGQAGRKLAGVAKHPLDAASLISKLFFG